jgi:hypothetical protein
VTAGHWHRPRPPEPHRLLPLQGHRRDETPGHCVGQRRLQRRRQLQRALPADGGLVRLPGHRVRRALRRHAIDDGPDDDGVHRLRDQGGRHGQVRQRRRRQDHGGRLLLRRRRGHGTGVGPARQVHRRLLVGAADQLHGGLDLFEACLLRAGRIERRCLRKCEPLCPRRLAFATPSFSVPNYR